MADPPRDDRPLRGYHEVGGDDRSGLGDQVAAGRARIEARLSGVRKVVAVMSGKGGVGKSYVTAATALAAAQVLPGVGVLDADLTSPTVARLLHAKGPMRVADGAVTPVTGRGGVRVFSTDLMLEDGAPLDWRGPAQHRFVWRGAMEHGALRDFLADVNWGRLGLLLVDLPPGADGPGDLVTLVPNLAGALVVTVPSEESRRSVARSMRAARAAGVALLGVVENMSGHRCGKCAHMAPLFGGDAGETLADEFDVPLAGRVPFEISPYPDAPPLLPTPVAAKILECLR